MPRMLNSPSDALYCARFIRCRGGGGGGGGGGGHRALLQRRCSSPTHPHTLPPCRKVHQLDVPGFNLLNTLNYVSEGVLGGGGGGRGG